MTNYHYWYSHYQAVISSLFLRGGRQYQFPDIANATREVSSTDTVNTGHQFVSSTIIWHNQWCHNSQPTRMHPTWPSNLGLINTYLDGNNHRTIMGVPKTDIAIKLSMICRVLQGDTGGCGPGLRWRWVGCSSVFPSCLANSAKLPAAPVLLGR